MINHTAVDWLQEQLKKGVDFNPLDENSYLDNVENLFQQAKSLEKHQQKLIYEGMLQNVGTSINKSDLPTFEEYYKGTYGKA